MDVADKDGAAFSDGNAAADDTKFYKNTSDIDKIPWEVLPDVVEPRFIIDIKCVAPEEVACPGTRRHMLVCEPQYLNPSRK